MDSIPLILFFLDLAIFYHKPHLRPWMILSTLDCVVYWKGNKQRVLMHGHQGWNNVRHGLCHIYMIYVYIWVVNSICLFCCLFIIVTTQFVALYKPCKPKPKPSTYYHPPPPHPPPPPPPPPPPTPPHPPPHPPTHPPPQPPPGRDPNSDT